VRFLVKLSLKCHPDQPENKELIVI